jgi:hypothetical protein
MQIFVVGRTCLILADNYHTVEELEEALDWADVNRTITGLVDTVLFSSHHDTDAPTNTLMIMNGLGKYFSPLRVRGNVNHIHANGVYGPAGGWQDVWMTGGNGFHDGGGWTMMTCAEYGKNCCPSLWSQDGDQSTFLTTGYGPGEVCEALGTYNSSSIGLSSSRLNAALVSNFQSSTRSSVAPTVGPDDEGPLIASIMPTSLHDHYILNNHMVFAPILKEDIKRRLGIDERLVNAYIKHWGISDGYAQCDGLPNTPSKLGTPGINCYIAGKSSSQLLAATEAKLEKAGIPLSKEPIAGAS